MQVVPDGLPANVYISGALSCLRMVLEVAVLVCKACLWMQRFSRFVVFLGLPDLHLSWTFPVARKH